MAPIWNAPHHCRYMLHAVYKLLETTRLRANFPVNQNFQKAVGSLATRRRNIGSLVSSDWVTEQQPAPLLIAHFNQDCCIERFAPLLCDHTKSRSRTATAVLSPVLPLHHSRMKKCHTSYKLHCESVTYKNDFPPLPYGHVLRDEIVSFWAPFKPTLALINLRGYFFVLSNSVARNVYDNLRVKL